MDLLENRQDAPTEALPVEQTDPEELSKEEEALNCTACGQPVTSDRHRTSINGDFQHAVVNPAGILFEIGCFAEAEGCREVGPESDEFSWFDGYVWQVAVCTGCRTHLGWRFWSSDNVFYGLILNRLA
jgi:hypothetical protein